ncbi:hypothetical protein C2I18_27865 [Paenibacillus sp. PK3_47]|uniref:ABC-2 transporter permease n=1 Tax=Paenibacillus sp. PK3_47 TaxID=2072642 RepID=UPI00201D3ADD|nr:ABC-2 transporter permease [Paenibacillus sp. PK3_47]UQZ37016.1 hypothetical protein C2I18_27865 [Paenibacillus sp. PK3_47]
MYSSFYLIRKDFALIRKFVLLLIPYFILMGYTNFDSYTMFTLFPAMLLLINSCTMDVQHNNQKFLVSLPLRRQQLVLAKYLALIPYCVISLVFTLLLYTAGYAFGLTSEPLAWREILLSIGSFPVLAAIYLPLHYWLGQKGAQVVNLIFIMMIMLNVTAFSRLTQKVPVFSNWILTGNTDGVLIPLIAGLAYIVVIYSSYLLSLRIFLKKDV